MDENEIDKFFGDLPTEDRQLADIFNEVAPEDKPAENAGGAAAPEKDDEPRKNRRHRRLETQLQEEREARIRAEARATAQAEFGSKAAELNVDERLVRLYGAENTEAARLHMELLTDYATKAEERAFDRFRGEQEEEQQAVAKFETFVETELESIEDEFNVDITSDAPAARKMRHEFKALVEKLSPKDENGFLTGYADFHEAFELYQAKRERAESPSRAKDIASRSMQRPGGSSAPANASPEPTPGFRGWMKDFHVNGQT